MKPLPCFCRLVFVFAWLGLDLHAKELASYRVGDIADADVITPVALEVVDTNATAALQSTRATQYPAVFRCLPLATNELAHDFLAAFAHARTNFLASLADEFHASRVDTAIIESSDFGRLVTAYDVEHKEFPVPDELAAEWARGGDGQAFQEITMAALMQTANRHLLSGPLPKELVIGGIARLVPVTEENQKLSFETVQRGQLTTTASLISISNAQALFRREFPAGQQLLARALADWIKPNCFLDVPFTKLTRGTAVCQMIVSDHYDAGDVLVRQGDAIDAKTQAVLACLSEKLKSAPSGQTNPPVSVAIAQVQSQPPRSAGLRPGSRPITEAPPPPLTNPLTSQKMALVKAPLAKKPASTPQKPVPTAVQPSQAVILTLTVVSAALLLAAGWQWLQRKSSSSHSHSPSSVKVAAPHLFSEANQAELMPQVSQVMREAVQQELGSQRRDLLLAQQAATGEIASLVHRLDELQAPLQERLGAYESRIQTLEKELALRNEENRQLLTLKIEMVRRQMETERTATLAPLNP